MNALKVSVIVPARQCAAMLPESLDRIVRQSRPADEIIIAVGPSTDGTRRVADVIAARSDRITVIDNPRGDRASALNTALTDATGDVVAFVDAQSLLDSDYIEQSLGVMNETKSPIVGGPMRPVGRNAVGRAVARALVSPFGIGDSAFHFSGQAQEADSVYLGVYRRTVFDTVGRYDETLLRTEDDDFNERARRAGFRIRLDPRIRSTYLCRDSLVGLWRQYHGYGYWKVPLFVSRPSAFRVRHAVPGGAVIAGALVGLLGMRHRRPYLAFAAAGYAAVAAMFDERLGGQRSLGVKALFPVVTATMHLGYGIGSLQGAIRYRRALRTLIGRGRG
jgi:glycosyltransferase involved in cell wall biosynthesis